MDWLLEQRLRSRKEPAPTKPYKLMIMNPSILRIIEADFKDQGIAHVGDEAKNVLQSGLTLVLS